LNKRKIEKNIHEGSKLLGKNRIEATGKLKDSVSGKDLVSEVEGLEVEQQSLIEGATIEQGYQETLAMYIQSKHEQVESIEDRLENLIDRQQARLQQSASKRPGFFYQCQELVNLGIRPN